MKTKKELKEEYKNMEIPMGVFQIKNITNNMAMIDNSTNMLAKWNRHRTELRLGNHRNKSLQKAWNEYGEDNFIFNILAELKEIDLQDVNYRKELNILQKMVIEEMDLTIDVLYK